MVELKQTVDLVLNELISTMQPSVSLQRILEKHGVDVNPDDIRTIEEILLSKSLVAEEEIDSEGHRCYAITETGRDFLKTFGTYRKYLKGIESEHRKVERARKKKPYKVRPIGSNGPASPFIEPEPSFLKRNRVPLLILLFMLLIFYIASRLTESLG